jgi:two-component system chemotaxis response regulator CheY
MEREQHHGLHVSPGPASIQADPTRIFVVEDNDLTRWTLKNIIGRDSRLSLVGDAADGVSALERMNVLQPDLICLDIHMPRLDGLSVLRTVREQYPPTAVVIITGEATPEVLTQARKLGAEGFVVKPFNAAKVLDTIFSALARHRGSDRRAAAISWHSDEMAKVGQ